MPMDKACVLVRQVVVVEVLLVMVVGVHIASCCLGAWEVLQNTLAFAMAQCLSLAHTVVLGTLVLVADASHNFLLPEVDSVELVDKELIC